MVTAIRKNDGARKFSEMMIQLGHQLILEMLITAFVRLQVTDTPEDNKERMEFYKNCGHTVVGARAILEALPFPIPIMFKMSEDAEVMENTEGSVKNFPIVVYDGINEASPTFDGTYCKWDSFWSQFTAIIDRNPRLDVILKFKRLREPLKGDAYKHVRRFRFIEANYELVKMYLEQTYGSPSRILQYSWNRIMTWHSMRERFSCPDFSGVGLLVQENLRDLVHFRPEARFNSEDTIMNIRCKLPKHLLVSWERQASNIEPGNHLAAFDQFLSREMALERTAYMDYAGEQARRGQGRNGDDRNRPTAFNFANHVDAKQPLPPDVCPWCGEKHQPISC